MEKEGRLETNSWRRIRTFLRQDSYYRWWTGVYRKLVPGIPDRKRAFTEIRTIRDEYLQTSNPAGLLRKREERFEKMAESLTLLGAQDTLNEV